MEQVGQVNTKISNLIKTVLWQHLFYFLKISADDNPNWKELNHHIKKSILMYSSHELGEEDLWLRRQILLHYSAVLRNGYIFMRVINTTGRPVSLYWTNNEQKAVCIQVLRPGQNCLVVGSQHFGSRWAARYAGSNIELCFLTRYCNETKELIIRLCNDLHSLKDICIDTIRTKIGVNIRRSNLPETLLNNLYADKNVEPERTDTDMETQKSPKVLRFHPWAIVIGNPYALRAECAPVSVWHSQSYTDELHELVENLKYYTSP